MRGILAAAISCAALASSGGASAENASFKDWTVVCDNTRACTAYGFSPESQETIAYLKLERGAGAADLPRASLSADTGASGDWRLLADGKPVAGLERVRASAEGDAAYATASLTTGQAAALVQAIRNAQALQIRDGAKSYAISLAGGAAALRWLDDQQKRVGTVTALVARGDKPASAVSAPPPVPLVRAAAASSQAGLPKRLPKSLQAQFKDCDDDIAEIDAEPTIARLAPGVMLWGAACSRGAYNVSYKFLLSDEQGRGVRSAIPEVEDAGEGSALINADFDLKTMTLSAFAKGRGIADCGDASSWVWTGKVFARESSQFMPECRGVPPDDWPTAFRSRAR